MPDLSQPRFASAVSAHPDVDTAAREVCAQAKAALNSQPHLVMVFASADYQPDFAQLASILRAELGIECILGCTGESLVADDREIEGQRAVVLWVAHLPGVTLVPMHLEYQRTADGGTFNGWPGEPGDEWPTDASLLLLAEPYSFPADALLQQFNDDRPGVRIVGGMASGGSGPGENRLLLGGREVTQGAVAVLIHGPIKLRTIVSQGCRPIGRPFVITKGQRNVILELGGRPALEQFQDLYQTLTPDEQLMARQGLHVGQVISEYQERFGRGDFLVRNLQAADPKSGAIAIGDLVRVGQTVQFHVRDAETADEDLNALLSVAKQELASNARGALVFTCNGRGSRLFPEPHHDAQAVARHWNRLPAAGFFAQGEIGPIGGRNFLHGFTASIAIFEPCE